MPVIALVAPLLFGSGLCALVYQVAWQREFRLIFGASTAASAAVLAIFIGSLGWGGLVLGRRADRHPRPLRFYANLEILIALSTACTPAPLSLVRLIYTKVGGTQQLGFTLGTVVRLILAALVLAVPTFLMGGTLPAAARAVERDEDRRRNAVALLYGINTLGAVTGAGISTFVLLEALGTRSALWAAVLANLVVALIARVLSGRPSDSPPSQSDAFSPSVELPRIAARWTLLAAGLVGFAFFLMELVWYRMLGPLLGGSVFTFGLILAVALLGIGVGGALYSLFGEHRPATLTGFSLTCLFEAVAVIMPFALGDRLALLALLARSLKTFGFGGIVAGWSMVSMLVILPAAIVAGFQFPLLIALLGRGRAEVGRQIGLTYVANTVGAAIGALAGGFALMPWLTAPGCWRLVASLLVLLGTATALAANRRRPLALLLPGALIAAVALMASTTGPTAVWRHSSIGVGRVRPELIEQPNDLRDWENRQRRDVRWEAEGTESSVAAVSRNALALVINGKVDGNARNDAANAVMTGLLGAALHPEARRAMVVGLGTGTTAGWLGAVPSIERVDVAELEKTVLDVAAMCASVTQDVMHNPRVHVTVADAREVLATSREHYDIIASEPSNPYRAGVASLFTREFYRAIADHLNGDGLLLQWVQAYEVDGASLGTIYATLSSVFPQVMTWQLQPADLLLVASRRPVTWNLERLRARLESEPFRSGMAVAWRAAGLDGFAARYVGGTALARALAADAHGVLNTDDRTVIEFGFARNVGRASEPIPPALVAMAHTLGDDQIPGADSVGRERLDEEHLSMELNAGLVPAIASNASPGQRARGTAMGLWMKGDWKGAAAAWRQQSDEPVGSLETMVVADALAEMADARAEPYAEALRVWQPIEADVVLARFYHRSGRTRDAAALLVSAFQRYHLDPWPFRPLMERALELATEVSKREPSEARSIYASLREPFAVYAAESTRWQVRIDVASVLGPSAVLDALMPLEPYPSWRRERLRLRRETYAAARSALASVAEEEWSEFLAQEPSSLRPPRNN